MNKQHLNVRVIITIVIGLISIGAITWILVSSRHDNSQQEGAKLAIGSIAPNFELTNTAGQKMTLSDYRGKVVILNFWASWCQSCVKEMPLINNVFQSNRSDVATIFINVGESKGTVNNFLSTNHFDFPVIIDVTGKVSSLYGVVGLPATFIIDKQGKLAQLLLGEINSDSQLQEYIKAKKDDQD
ncbi:peroxiredoxin [Paenibacillus anaericanus]|uniref:redoxin domain-containing protein n=1 Tax=Paenibacillus anaericanus TaxID=170367 RepID=UPI00277EA760|nr:redoxin domain-containing protein [Paenibacillus anaericanus]MDQ0087070.1 peroxiredoxin [Paenibacillus anaericanus]